MVGEQVLVFSWFVSDCLFSFGRNPYTSWMGPSGMSILYCYKADDCYTHEVLELFACENVACLLESWIFWLTPHGILAEELFHNLVTWWTCFVWLIGLFDEISSKSFPDDSLRVSLYWLVATCLPFLQEFAWWLPPRILLLCKYLGWVPPRVCLVAPIEFLLSFCLRKLILAWMVCKWFNFSFWIFRNFGFGSETNCFSFLQRALALCELLKLLLVV